MTTMRVAAAFLPRPALAAISASCALEFLVEQLREVKIKLVEIEQDLAVVAREVNACHRLRTIPGVGIITATELATSRDTHE